MTQHYDINIRGFGPSDGSIEYYRIDIMTPSWLPFIRRRTIVNATPPQLAQLRNMLNNALTRQAPSHNKVAMDGTVEAITEEANG